MTDSDRIERVDNGVTGRYFVRFPDDTEGEMTYRYVAPGVISIDHTGVPRHHRGGGHALKLVEAGIADARREGLRIVPACPYVDLQFDRHPAWADLRA